MCVSWPSRSSKLIDYLSNSEKTTIDNQRFFPGAINEGKIGGTGPLPSISMQITLISTTGAMKAAVFEYCDVDDYNHRIEGNIFDFGGCSFQFSWLEALPAFFPPSALN